MKRPVNFIAFGFLLLFFSSVFRVALKEPLILLQRKLGNFVAISKALIF